MTLIGESSADGDFDKRRAGVRQFPTGRFDAQTADVISHRAMVPLPESPGQVNGMHIDGIGQFLQCDRLAKPVVEHITDTAQPSGVRLATGGMGFADQSCDKFQRYPFYSQLRRSILLGHFPLEPESELQKMGVPAMHTRSCLKTVVRQRRQKMGKELKVQKVAALRREPVCVSLAGSMEDGLPRLTFVCFSADMFGVKTAQRN